MSNRERLAQVAETESGARHTADMPGNAGSLVEKYLAPFRRILDQRAGTQQFEDNAVGFAWCGAFAHWCCRAAGFDLPLQPQEQSPTFALVSAWRQWAVLGDGASWFAPEDFSPQRGDLVVYRHLSHPLRDDCHLGVVVGISPSGKTLYSAEGNVVFGRYGEGRRTQIKRRRRHGQRVMGFIRLHEN
ncbi:MAG: CHAP domain-containing protein [Candidatus Cloacimonetes bacterium]|nr:CHAP domain-containing protein [Candidatus Cloacimonadota bacterium]